MSWGRSGPNLKLTVLFVGGHILSYTASQTGRQQSAVCQLSQRSRLFEQAIVRQWIALTSVGGGKTEGLGGEMRYG
jgi:hypothetical protein